MNTSLETMDEGLEPNRPQFAAGEIQAICLSSCEILERGWGETRSISNNNYNTYFRLSEYEGVVFITFPSFYIGDFTAGDSPYEQCDIQNENEVFSASLRGDDDQPALVHKGALAMFLYILRNSNLETQMSTFSKQRREQKIIFVGHSIGGAIATLATIWVLGKMLRQISANCITFGSPLVGDIVLMESIDRHEWSSNFCHVVSQHDLVPRMFLAPFESIGQHLNSIYPQRGSIMGNDSVNLMHPSTPEDSRKLMDNVKCLREESSPYKPIGTYMFCSIYGAACIEHPQAVLKMLILTLQNTEENVIVAENGIAAALIISEHISYGDKLKHVIESGYSTRTSNIVSESSIQMGIALQLKAMGFQTQNQSAFEALKEAEDLKKQHEMDNENLNKELSKSQSKMAELEFYIKKVCESNSRSSYDVFRDLDEKRDFHVNKERISLQIFWDDIIEKVKNHELPSSFRFLNKWINAGTAYRRLVEPLDIADFYRRQSNNGSYLSVQNRQVRHMVLEKWLDDKNQTRTSREKKRRTKFASLTEDSCFWTHVEEAAKDLTNLQQEQEQYQVINAHHIERVENFEGYVLKMIEEKSISKEVFLEQSSFMLWWKKYREFQLQYPGWILKSPLLKSMENLNLEVENVREKGARKHPRGDNIEVVNVREKGAHKRPRVDDIEDTMSKEMRSTISSEGGNTNTLSSVNVTLPFIQNTMSKEMSSTISNEGGSKVTATKLEAILTTNAIRSINTGEFVANPILQILSFKRQSIFQDELDRYKIVLSDGNHMQLAIFRHKSNDLFFSDMLKIQSIVSLTNYVCQATADSRTLIIFSLEVIHRDYQMIGKPKYLYKSQEQQMVEEQTTVSPNKSTKFGIHLPPREHGLPESIIPIKDLNPYQSRWTIKGRVTTKRQLRQFNNQWNSGQVFSFDIIDNEDTETRIVCFNDIAELHYDRVHIGAMYTISKGSVKEANRKYNKLNSHMEITLDHTSVLKCCDDEFPVGSVQYNFKKINEIANINNYTLVDIIGAVVSVAEISTIRRSDGSEVLCRTLKLVDISFSTIDVNLWGSICQKEGEHLKSLKTSKRVVVLAIRNGRVAEFKGKVINSTAKTVLTIEPLIPEAEALHSKFEQEQIDIPSLSLFSTKTNQTTNNMTIASIIELCKSMTNPLDATIKATVKFIKSDSFCYPACPLLVNGKECKKKCVQSNENTWFCSRCQTSIAECKYKYLLQLKLQDHTGAIWAVAFDEVATNLLHMPARELYLLQYDTQVEATPQGIINAVFFNRFIFTLSITNDLYNSEARIKTTITRATKVDFHNECESLLAEISEISTSK